jgi:lipopolysaccharide assembly protein A
MQFLKTLFWVALTIGAILFSSFNWTTVVLNLWGGLQADVKLPVLLLAAFLLGFLPMFGLHRARMWSARRRADAFERQIALMQAPPPPAPPVVVNDPAPAPIVAAEDRPATLS